MTNEGVENRDTSNDDNDNNACKSDDEEEQEETEYDIPNKAYDFLSNYSKHKLIKFLLCYIRCQEAHISKIKDLKKRNPKLSQENVKLRKSNDSLSNDIRSFQEKFGLLEKEKDELQMRCANLEKIVLNFSEGEEN